ncbi:hypothetical protein [Sphingomonas sp. M1-B02]|uniref:hypothetical protein n=1 Tax=Sphingomonas sp. M1-B02 TaxID=3114300 RepID=UPI00223EE44B|nr:hypothetical protein [Sphingomonas sp. S6-11]UZK64643.1 hypothetical protein OKW87_08765 [Sphingomonas sp. S6-11]
MFYRLSLTESFRFVASTKQWTDFCRYGEVTGTDLWVSSMAAGSGPGAPHRLDGFEELWSGLASAVKHKLLAGEWAAEGFAPESGAHPISIDSNLWRSLEFDIFEQAAVGSGFKFSNLLLSAKSALIPSLASQDPVPLSQVLDLVATSEERIELASLRPLTPRPRLLILGAPDPHAHHYDRLGELEEQLWLRARQILISGQWRARGLPKGTHEITDIQPELWRVLECRFWRDEVFVAGGTVEIAHVTVRPRKASTDASEETPGTLRRAVGVFLREQFETRVGPVKKDDLFLELRSAVSNHISRNLFEEVWDTLRKAGQIPDGFTYGGRPPEKAPGFKR